MRTLDFSPFYPSTVGFDRVANLLDNLVTGETTQSNYPPYNIEVTGEDHYRVTLALAGFNQSDLEIEAQQNQLTVRGRKPESDSQEERRFLHRGIAARNFERRFQLADHVRVDKASFENGLLHIELARELPERMKPRSIAIHSDEQPQKELT